MVDTLAELVVAFPGATNRMRCFTHILNLVVKVMLCQFDVPKAKAGEALDVASQALSDLVGDIEMEEMAMDKMTRTLTIERKGGLIWMGCHRKNNGSSTCQCVQCS